MPVRVVHDCACGECRAGQSVAVSSYHRQINLLLSRLDEPQRRWYVATLSLEPGSPSDARLSEITGVDEKTIRRGRTEMQEGLANVPQDRQRREGAGRPPAEKKTAR